MRMLLGLASLVAIALPSSVTAQSSFATQGFSSSSGSVRIHRGDRRGRRSDCEISTGTWIDGGEWALYNNRSWESNSYNDWWHDQPWRSYPRWVTKNEDCQRQWWSGGGWRC